MTDTPNFAKSRRFAPLFLTQFLGAFNDNLFKTTLFVLISFYGLGKNGWLPSSQMLNLGSLLFVLPYFLFSAVSGQLSTRFNKARIAQTTKFLEICIMALASYGFYTASAPLLLFCLFLMGTHSSLFGPVKYAILPEYLKENELIMGNGLIESGTFLAILFGQIIGTSIAGQPVWLVVGIVLAVAVCGFAASLFMPSVAAKDPTLRIRPNIIRGTKELIRQTCVQKDLTTAIIGISWFWFVGAVYTTQLPTFVQIHLGGNDNVFNLMLTLFSVGIATGSVLCAKLSKGSLKLWLVAVGTVGLSLSGCLLVWLVHGSVHPDPQNLSGIFAFLAQGAAYPIILVMLAIGFFGGFFSVPLYTWLQTASSDEFRAGAIAANNIANGVFMVAAALLSALLLYLFDSITLLYLIVAVGNLPVLAWLAVRAPQMLFPRKKS